MTQYSWTRHRSRSANSAGASASRGRRLDGEHHPGPRPAGRAARRVRHRRKCRTRPSEGGRHRSLINMGRHRSSTNFGTTSPPGCPVSFDLRHDQAVTCGASFQVRRRNPVLSHRSRGKSQGTGSSLGAHRHADLPNSSAASDQVRQTSECLRSNETASDRLRPDTGARDEFESGPASPTAFHPNISYDKNESAGRGGSLGSCLVLACVPVPRGESSIKVCGQTYLGDRP